MSQICDEFDTMIKYIHKRINHYLIKIKNTKLFDQIMRDYLIAKNPRTIVHCDYKWVENENEFFIIGNNPGFKDGVFIQTETLTSYEFSVFPVFTSKIIYDESSKTGEKSMNLILNFRLVYNSASYEFIHGKLIMNDIEKLEDPKFIEQLKYVTNLHDVTVYKYYCGIFDKKKLNLSPFKIIVLQCYNRNETIIICGKGKEDANKFGIYYSNLKQGYHEREIDVDAITFAYCFK